MEIRYRRAFFSIGRGAGVVALVLLVSGCGGDAPTETNLDAVEAAVSEAARADAAEPEAQEEEAGEEGATVADGDALPAPATAPAGTSTERTGPLFVLDGVVLPDDRAERETLIEAIEIDRIDVVRGALAISRYGPDGANGVVEITTKR